MSKRPRQDDTSQELNMQEPVRKKNETIAFAQVKKVRIIPSIVWMHILAFIRVQVLFTQRIAFSMHATMVASKAWLWEYCGYRQALSRRRYANETMKLHMDNLPTIEPIKTPAFIDVPRQSKDCIDKVTRDIFTTKFYEERLDKHMYPQFTGPPLWVYSCLICKGENRPSMNLGERAPEMTCAVVWCAGCDDYSDRVVRIMEL